MNHNDDDLEQIANLRKIHVHDPFAEFLQGGPLLHRFDISLLDCYRMAGHACHAITGAYLTTEAAIHRLFPEDKTCERGDLTVQFGSNLEERATGPRSNIVSFITGAWAESGFPGLGGRFNRKNLVSYGHSELAPNAIRFSRISNGDHVVVRYDCGEFLSTLGLNLEFPAKWRAEIRAILQDPAKVLSISERN